MGYFLIQTVLSLSCVMTSGLRFFDGDRLPTACELNAGKGLATSLLKRADECADGITIHGEVEQFGEEIDEFLIPLSQWRVTRTSNKEVVLHPLPPQLSPLFENLNRVQFAPRRDTCDGVVSVSPQYVGAATQDDLKRNFVRWYNSQSTKPFVPIWMDKYNPANTSNFYSEPFCHPTSSPTHRQDCYFLPPTNCIMGAQQWERVRNQLDEGTSDEIEINLMKQNTRANLKDSGLQVLWQMLFFRQNARTRSEIAQREISWRAENPSWPELSSAQPDASVTCAAIHVRHGDKLTPFWEEHHHTIQDGFNRTLDEYLDEALNLMQKKTGVDVGAEARIMVMSDDADIIEASMKTKRATTFHVNEKIKHLSEVLNSEDKDFQYGKAGSEDMLQWLLAIRLMSACDIFVGNLMSGFTKFIYHGICEQRQGNCPKTVTLGCGSENSEEFNVDVSQPSIVQPAPRCAR